MAFANGMVNAIKRLCKDEIGVLPDQTAYADLLNELCSSNCNNQGDCVGGIKLRTTYVHVLVFSVLYLLFFILCK